MAFALLMRLVTPDPSADDSRSRFEDADAVEAQVARAYFVWPNSQ